MDIVRLNVEPQLAREPMAEAITRLGVQHHLGRASRATGEVYDARIVAAGQIALVVRCGVPHAGIKVGPARLLGVDD